MFVVTILAGNQSDWSSGTGLGSGLGLGGMSSASQSRKMAEWSSGVEEDWLGGLDTAAAGSSTDWSASTLGGTTPLPQFEF